MKSILLNFLKYNEITRVRPLSNMGLPRCTYLRIYFSMANTTAAHHLWLIEFVDADV